MGIFFLFYCYKWFVGIYGIVFKVKYKEMYEIVVLKWVWFDEDDEVNIIWNIYDCVLFFVFIIYKLVIFGCFGYFIIYGL